MKKQPKNLFDVPPIDPKELEGLSPKEKAIKMHEHFVKSTGVDIKVDDTILDLLSQLIEE